ncbi:MAG: UDP-3-O-acyl-N-acetylglucosamine deacetylase [Thiohalomonadales bacterium]
MNINHRISNTTIRQSVSFTGRGLHTGNVTRITLIPCYDNKGIYFVRNDRNPTKNVIYTNFINVSDSKYSTYLTNQHGVSVHTIEHLLSALSICRIDNVRIETDGAEIPMTAGGAKDFVSTIFNAGVNDLSSDRRAIWIKQPIAVSDGDMGAILLPNPVSRFTVRIDYPGATVSSLYYTVALLGDNYFFDIVFARTFKFTNQLEDRRQQGLQSGASLISAALGGTNQYKNSSIMTRHNELVRRKILGAIGDLSLAGMPIMGHYLAYKADRSLNRKLLRKMFQEKGSWTNLPTAVTKPNFFNSTRSKKTMLALH